MACRYVRIQIAEKSHREPEIGILGHVRYGKLVSADLAKRKRLNRED